MAKNRLVLAGAGRMGGALATGWLDRRPRAKPVVLEPAPAQGVLDWAEHGRITRSPDQAAPADRLVIAVKPQVFHDVAATLRPWIGPETLVVSVMAGLRIRTLETALDTGRIVRAMPNTPGALGIGITAIAAGPGIDTEALSVARSLLEPLGPVEGPLSEEALSAATAVSGAGPAYLFLLAEVMAGAGEAEGLEPALADRLARRTVEGAAALLAQHDGDPGELRRAVASPGGVTQAALDILMADGGLPTLMRKAVHAAVLRDRALARPVDEGA